MPRRFTMTRLIAQCRQRCDMVNDALISDAEFCTLISEVYGQMYTAAAETGLEYFEYTATLTSDGTNVISEIPDMMFTVELAYVVNSQGLRRDLVELMAQERSARSGYSGPFADSFALVDDKIYLYPTPPSGQTYEMRYVPQPPDLVEFVGGQSTLVDVVTPDGEAFITYAVAVKARLKQESDVTAHVAERDAALSRFMESVQARALNQPRRRVQHGGMLEGYYGDNAFNDPGGYWIPPFKP